MTQNSNPVVNVLEKTLADTFTLALKTQNYHWNVEGPTFYELHGMFEEQYDNSYEAVDDLAERLRAIGAQAPGGLAAFREISEIADARHGLKAGEMLDDLIASQATVAETLRHGISVAEEAGDVVTADMLTGRLTEHEKQAWMLRSARA